MYNPEKKILHIVQVLYSHSFSFTNINYTDSRLKEGAGMIEKFSRPWKRFWRLNLISLYNLLREVLNYWQDDK